MALCAVQGPSLRPSGRASIIEAVPGFSPSELREMRAALAAFQSAYVAYLQNPTPATKSAAVHAMPDAELALFAGGGGVTLLDPPAMGPMRQQYRGLSQTAFIHETSWGDVNGRPTYELVLEGIDSCEAVLEAEERRVAAARRKPSYWLDRAVRTALMPAAYLVSVIVGESAGKIDRSAAGLPLRLVSIVADVAGVYGAGKLIGL
jgi:hypothetical protein